MTLRQAALGAALVGVPLGVISDLLFVAAFRFPLDPAALVRPDILTADPTLLRWAAFTDFCSFYAPLAPIALYLRQRFAGRSALLDVYVVAALAALAIGGGAALVLGAVGPALAAGYATAAVSARPAYEVAATAVVNAVFGGVWQTFDALALGVFFLGTGRLLRGEQPRFGALSILTGLDAILAALARIVGLDPVAIVAVVLWLPLLTVWAAWLGLTTLRRGDPELAPSA